MIYKGCQKRMIMLKNTGSDIFEEAYFILKENKNRGYTSENDMIKEANRIVSDNNIVIKKDKKIEKNRAPIFFYLLGTLSGIGLYGLVMSFLI